MGFTVFNASADPSPASAGAATLCRSVFELVDMAFLLDAQDAVGTVGP